MGPIELVHEPVLWRPLLSMSCSDNVDYLSLHARTCICLYLCIYIYSFLSLVYYSEPLSLSWKQYILVLTDFQIIELIVGHKVTEKLKI